MFYGEVALLLFVTVLLGSLLHRVRQPVVISYILAGIVVGPQVLEWLQSPHELELFSQAGIMFLLFIVGLHLNPTVLKEVGVTALVTGVGQIVFTSAAGVFISLALGYPLLQSIFIAIALTFSSTIIIMKLLSDRSDMHKLYAKISIGFLLIQDLAATLILIMVPLFANQNPQSGSVGLEIARVLAVSGAAVVGLTLFAKYLLPRAFKNVSSSTELLFLTSITWGIGAAALLTSAGLSLEVGALLAGILLSTSPYASEIASRLKPLRDFFLVIFFVLLGSQLQFAEVMQVLSPALLLSGFVLIGNPLIVYMLMQLLGYSKKVSFQAGLTVAQISEFSLILIAVATQLYSLPSTVVALVTLVGIITIAASTYLILYSDQLFAWLEPILQKIPVPMLIDRGKSNTKKSGKNKHTVLWFGIDPIQDQIHTLFKGKKVETIFVDYNPDHIAHADSLGLNSHFGDATDVEFLSQLNWHEINTVVSLIPDENINQLIIKTARQQDADIQVVVISRSDATAQMLKELGADQVVLPFHLSSKQIERVVKIK